MTIQEFVAKLKEAEGTTPTERLETLRELVEVSELDLDTIVRIAKALHDPELTCKEVTAKTAEKLLSTTHLTTRSVAPSLGADRR